MSKNNEVPYIPKRDPREVNVVKRIKDLTNYKTTFIDDEEVQNEDIEKAIKLLIESGIGVPGGLVPIGENGLIDPKYLPPSAGGAAVMTARTLYELPTIGVEDVVYMTTEENDGKGYIYRWCEGLHCYQRPDDDLSSVSEICGGSAEGI